MKEDEFSEHNHSYRSDTAVGCQCHGPDLVAMAKIAEVAVQRVGDLLTSRHGDQSRNMKDTHGPALDYATETDIIAERMLREALEKTGIPVHGEEENGADPLIGWCWVVDPIDGTLNWANNLPICAISVGLCDRGVPKLGVILTPALRRRMSIGIVGLGAWVDGEPIAVSSVTPKEAVVAYDGFRDAGKDISAKIRAVVGRYRLMGSTATEMALCANGGFGAVISPEAMFWDVAAGIALIQAAGGVVVDMNGNPPSPGSGSVIAGSGGVVAAIVEGLGGDRSYADQANNAREDLRKLGSPVSHLTNSKSTQNVSTREANDQHKNIQAHGHQPKYQQFQGQCHQTHSDQQSGPNRNNGQRRESCETQDATQYSFNEFRIDANGYVWELAGRYNSGDKCCGHMLEQMFEEREHCCRKKTQTSLKDNCCARGKSERECSNK